MPDQMVIFMKPNSAIGNTLVSFSDEPLHYEAEICFIVKNKQLRGVAAGLDLTRRGLQSTLKQQGLPWERAKAFDGSALFSPFVEIEKIPPSLSIELLINDEMRQQGSIDLMLFRPHKILDECNRFLTLIDDDIIMTGTPKGVGVVHAGDTFVARIRDGKKVLTSAQWTAQ